MLKKMMALCLIAGLASIINAATVWNPANNGIYPPAVGDWNTAKNWTNGVPQAVTTDDFGKAVYNVPNAAECVISSAAVCKYFVQGDGADGGVIRVVDGGTLNTGVNWSAVGYSNTAHMIVESGGTVTFGQHMWIGLNPGSIGTLDINGGTVNVSQMIGLGWSGGIGFVNVNDGVLNLANIHGTDSIKGESKLDIEYGVIYLNGDRITDINNYVAAGKITGFGLVGNVSAEYINGKTVIKAVNDPMNPSPAMGESVPVGEVTLSWTNLLDPNDPADPLYIDVWLGTDPNKLEPAMYAEVLSNSPDGTSVTVNITEPGTYYWQVDTHIYGVTTDEPIEGRVYTFDTTSDLPPTSVVIETPDTLTWANEPVQLDATIVDDGASPLTIKWSVDPAIAANVTFSPSDSVEDPIITGDSHLGPITVTVTVGDAMNPDAVSDTMILDVAESACQGARGGFQRLDRVYTADFDGNCIINLLDFATLTSQWLVEYELKAPLPIQ